MGLWVSLNSHYENLGFYIHHSGGGQQGKDRRDTLCEEVGSGSGVIVGRDGSKGALVLVSL